MFRLLSAYGIEEVHHYLRFVFNGMFTKKKTPQNLVFLVFQEWFVAKVVFHIIEEELANVKLVSKVQSQYIRLYWTNNLNKETMPRTVQ